MEKINAVITGVGGYVPDYILTNEEISKMVDTNDEWIMTRIGVKERHILNEEGLGSSYMARKAAKQLMKKTGANPDDIDLVIVATTTPDYHFPSTASILCDKLGLKNAFAFDLQAACCGFLYLMETAANFIRSGRYKKIIIVGADKMSSMVNYTDRATCPIFGDGAAAFMVEPTTEDYGIMDSILRTDGKGLPFLHMKAGGSVCPPSYFTVDNKMHYLFQEGRTVFKYAVSNMSDVSAAIAEKNGLTKDSINWIVPHQANVRIIEAVAHRMDVPMDKVLVNIEHYGNTSAATLPLCIWDYEDKLKKGHVYILQTPLFRVRNKKKTVYCYSEDERVNAINELSPNPEITRFKGLGEISPDEFKHFIGKDMRLEQVTLRKTDAVKELLEFYMGKNTMERQNFIIDNLVIEEDLAS